jgi:hypothetical protein
MQASVRAAWCDFNRSLEGWVSWMYLDVEGLVTTGMGNLIDPVEAAFPLPGWMATAPPRRGTIFRRNGS